MKTKTNIKKKILIAPAILLFALFFNLSAEINNDGSVKLFPVASACHKTYALSGDNWTDARASAEPCNAYCENLGYDKGAIIVSASKLCAGASCSYISDFNTGEQSETSNDGNCGCSYQFTCACSNDEVKKADLIIKDAYIKPENPTTNDNVCLYATIKNIGTKTVESHDLTAWTHVNGIHAANTFYGKSISVSEKITKEIFCSKYGDNVWFVKGENIIKINIDPESVNIVDELNEENNEKVLSFKITESVPETICGNGICEENESPYSCKADCAGWEEIFDTQKCTTWHASNVFNYSPCGDTKIYNVTPGDSLRLSAYGDNCASCVCYHVNFDLYDHISGEWVKVKTVDEPDEKTGIRSIFNYIPKGNKIKIVGTSGCFHFNLYKEKSGGDENSNDENQNNNSGNCLPDGTLIKLPNDPKIYVIRNCKKQWVRTAEEFKNSGYKWSDVNDTSKDVVDAYADYLEAKAKLLRAVGHNRIYRVINGRILWVPTVSAFNAQGLKWEDVQSTNETDVNKYPKVKLIKAKGDDRIFYVTDSGMKKHIINGEVFNSYNNKHSDVIEVSPEVISSFYTVDLFKDQNGNKIYKIEGNEKKWIKTAEAFRRHNFDWNKIVPANDVELNAYTNGENIE